MDIFLNLFSNLTSFLSSLSISIYKDSIEFTSASHSNNNNGCHILFSFKDYYHLPSCATQCHYRSSSS